MTDNILGFNFPGVGNNASYQMYTPSQQVFTPQTFVGNYGQTHTAAPSAFGMPQTTNGVNYWSNNTVTSQDNRRLPTAPSAFSFNSISPEDWQALGQRMLQIQNGPDAIDMSFEISDDGRTTTITLSKTEDTDRQCAVENGELNPRGLPLTITRQDGTTFNHITNALKDQRYPVEVSHEQVDENTLQMTFTTEKSHKSAIEKATHTDLGDDIVTDEETEAPEDEEQAEVRRSSSNRSRRSDADTEEEADIRRDRNRTDEETPEDTDHSNCYDSSGRSKKKSDRSPDSVEESENRTESRSTNRRNTSVDGEAISNGRYDPSATVSRPGLWSGSTFENWHLTVQKTRESNRHSAPPRQVSGRQTNDRLDATNANRQRYEPVAIAMARKYGIDEVIFTRKIMQESGFNPRAGSSAGALGIAQFIPSTGADYGLQTQADFFDPVKSLEASARYHRDILNRSDVNGDYAKALSVYNSGRPNAYKDPTFANGETYNYVRAILGTVA
jgi:Transglycosylase SLT domain